MSHAGVAPRVHGFQLGGILGMDFLGAAGAILDLGALTIEFSAPQAPA
jgi:hypothetical protein